MSIRETTHQNELWILAYFKHDGGFGYNVIQVTSSPIIRGFQFNLVAVDGKYNSPTLDDLVTGVKKCREEMTTDESKIAGYLNVVADLAQKGTTNPRRLEPDEEAEFMRKLFA